MVISRALLDLRQRGRRCPAWRQTPSSRIRASILAGVAYNEQGNEVLLIIKTRRDRFSALETLIRSHHPYELPEIVAVPIDTGLKDYLNWIDESLDITT